MALKIRLRRMGRKKAPHYRIVVAESTMPRDGRFVATVGHYNPTTRPETLKVDRDRANAWLEKGAVPTDTVRSLLRRAGVDAPAAEGAVESVVETVKGAAGKAGKAVKGAAAKAADVAKDAAGAVASAAASVAETVVDTVKDAAGAVADRVSGGDQPPVAAEAATEVGVGPEAGEPVALEAEATEPTPEATAPAGADEAAETPVAADAEATEPAAGGEDEKTA
ncbi:MAG TPA: 30S ribosomal protein S16 [Longimicrobium sp.]|jgi:small subunit ribosomal protein S16